MQAVLILFLVVHLDVIFNEHFLFGLVFDCFKVVYKNKCVLV